MTLNLVFLGPPGVGKGTYAKELSKRYNIPHISTGDIFREEIRKGTELGKKVKSYVERGELVPDEIVIEVVRKRLSQDDCKRGFILDGFPRTINQAIALDSIVKVDLVFNFVAPKSVIIERLSGRRICQKCGAIYHIKFNPPKRPGICDKCGGPLYQREDDKPEVIEERLRVYEKQTAPIVDYYRKKGILVEVDASRNMEEVIKDCEQILKAKGLLQ
ncbi:MAG: adenylate kinase [Thermoprotei archaeon]|nr:MAG: adenylate kinase [Thermoprotei archaeon]RLF18687.1 MAG: adenylate kinase [Thermoprotei archaeon]